MTGFHVKKISPTPNTPDVVIHLPVNNMKPATPDLIQFDQSTIPVESMTNLILEDIGGQELINISRSDIINGQNVLYNPISNLSAINSSYDPFNIFSIDGISQTIFNNFSIVLEDHVPEFGIGTGPSSTVRHWVNPLLPLEVYYVTIKDSVYLDSDGNIVIDITGLQNDDQIEIEVMTKTNTFLKTIW